LLARIEALTRRANYWQGGNGRKLIAGKTVFDRNTRLVTVDGAAVALTRKELGILELLLRRPGHMISRERILSGVWGANEDSMTNVVDVHIGRLRRKLDDCGRPGLTETVRGRGNRLADCD